MTVHHCTVNDPITTSLRHNNTPNSTARRKYKVNTLLECESNRTMSTRQCNFYTSLESQDISTTSTRHATLTI